jgi:DNA-binding response OmpR family regulator
MTDKILVIEDDEGISGTLYRGLTFEGYKVNVAYDGTSGLAAVRDEPPDLVILDWMLPGMAGLEVCKPIGCKDWTLALTITW